MEINTKENILVVFDSMSGNTKEVAEIIKEDLESCGDTVTMLHLQLSYPSDLDLSIYDRVILGTWSDNNGAIPADMLDFIEEWGDAIRAMQADKVNVFGTGETQWGEENFCLSVRNLYTEVQATTEVLEIEQFPAQPKQKEAIYQWVGNFVVEFKSVSQLSNRGLFSMSYTDTKRKTGMRALHYKEGFEEAEEEDEQMDITNLETFTDKYAVEKEKIEETQIIAQLTELRLRAGFTEKELADKLDLAENGIKLIEKGIVSPKLSTILSLAKLLGRELILVSSESEGKE